MAPGVGSCIKLIVGLGNPGVEYANSRHNAGFMVIEKLLAGFPEGRFTESHLAESRVFTGRFRGKNLVLQMPQTYMNLSGNAVAPLCRRMEIKPQEVIVISDDLDLAPGRLRLRQGGSDGGHNGLKSIIAELGSADFKRVRIGIGRPESGKTADYVLSGFEGDGEKAFAAAIERAAEAVKTILGAGMSTAMNKFNAAEKNDTEKK
ncbi:MAG: aminoacyl-tRNA hydrolase [Lentisphaerae bacterium]|nr:aminoacyl-tRNA hydrolase [Lentisphaerota bacterium]